MVDKQAGMGSKCKNDYGEIHKKVVTEGDFCDGTNDDDDAILQGVSIAWLIRSALANLNLPLASHPSIDSCWFVS